MEGVVLHLLRSVKDFDLRPVAGAPAVDPGGGQGSQFVRSLGSVDGRVQVVGLGVGTSVQPVVVGQAVGMGIVLADHQICQVLFCDELDQFLVEPVVVPVQGDVFPFQVHGDQGLHFFVVLFVIGQPPDLFVHIDGPGHEMPLVPPVGQHVIADQ